MFYQYWKIPETEPYFPRILIGTIQANCLIDADAHLKSLLGIDPTKDKTIVATLGVEKHLPDISA